MACRPIVLGGKLSGFACGPRTKSKPSWWYCHARSSARGTRASCEVVNPAYTSQTCPNCGFVSRKNRCGIKFQCCYCGKISHADVVGGAGLLRRSEDKQIGLDDYPAVVKPILEARHEEWKKFQVSLSALGRKKKALEPSSQELTTEVPSFFSESAQLRTRAGWKKSMRLILTLWRTVHGTGHQICDAATCGRYIGSAQMLHGRLIWHVFVEDARWP